MADSRALAFCCHSIGITQFLGAPLYFVSKDLYYAYMAQTKQSFGLFITTITHRWGPTIIRISGDASVAGQIRKTQDGLVEFAFPERMVMIANHQVPPTCCWASLAIYTIGPLPQAFYNPMEDACRRARLSGTS